MIKREAWITNDILSLSDEKYLYSWKIDISQIIWLTNYFANLNLFQLTLWCELLLQLQPQCIRGD